MALLPEPPCSGESEGMVYRTRPYRTATPTSVMQVDEDRQQAPRCAAPQLGRQMSRCTSYHANLLVTRTLEHIALRCLCKNLNSDALTTLKLLGACGLVRSHTSVSPSAAPLASRLEALLLKSRPRTCQG
jgi:hypothetical protein